MKLFPLSIKGEARVWLDSLPDGTIEYWNTLMEKFLSNRLLRSCPQHGLDTFHKVQTFYKGCNINTRVTIDQAAGGSLMDKTEHEAYEIIEKQAEYSHEWHEVNDLSRSSSSSVASAGAYDDFASINAKLDKFGRHLEKMDKDIHGMKVGCELCGGLHLAKDCDAGLTMNQKEEIVYISQQNNNQFQAYVISNSARYYRYSTNEKNDWLFRNQHTAIQNLEKQIGQIANQRKERKLGELPSNTDTNPKNGHVNAITTRSGLAYDPPKKPDEYDLRVPLVEENEPVIVSEPEVVKELKQVIEKVVKVAETVATKPVVKEYQPPLSYPKKQRLEKLEAKKLKFMELIKKVNVNLPFIDVIAGMPKYARFMKDLLTNWKKMESVSPVTLNAEFPKLQGTGECEIANGEEDMLDEVDLMTTLMAEGYEPTEEEHKELEKANEYGSKISIEEPPELEFKPLPEHLEYAFL
ncbi:uncharacterized protein [Rutidosis leptorrhynchoides]|uniref:uncharacterized protein n=1 Tax=Rutidosis leptorrhynchoides TaxID=125765 RepID=UPI003A99BC90